MACFGEMAFAEFSAQLVGRDPYRLVRQSYGGFSGPANQICTFYMTVKGCYDFENPYW